MWALQVPWGERRWLCVHSVTPATSEAALRGMLPPDAPELEALDYAGGRTGSLVFARPEDADAAFALLLVQSRLREGSLTPPLITLSLLLRPSLLWLPHVRRGVPARPAQVLHRVVQQMQGASKKHLEPNEMVKH